MVEVVLLHQHLEHPDIGSISVSIPTGASIEPFTEINKGGFQVIAKSDPSDLKLIKVEDVLMEILYQYQVQLNHLVTFLIISDERLKENIVQIPNSLDKIKQIKGVLFNWKEDYDKVHPYGQK